MVVVAGAAVVLVAVLSRSGGGGEVWCVWRVLPCCAEVAGRGGDKEVEKGEEGEEDEEEEEEEVVVVVEEEEGCGGCGPSMILASRLGEGVEEEREAERMERV